MTLTLDICVIVQSVRLVSADGWRPGLAPLSGDGVLADRASRSGYFNARVADVLYSDTLRLHRFANPAEGPTADLDTVGRGPVDGTGDHIVWCWEYLRQPGRSTSDGLLIAHITARGDEPGELLARIVRDAALATGVPGVEPADAGPPYSIVWMDMVGPQAAMRDPMPDYEWSTNDKWLWLLASRTPVYRYPPIDSRRPSADDGFLQLSRDWTAFVLRDGAAFLLHSRDASSYASFRGASRLYVHTIYLDALLLGHLQRLQLSDFADETARLLVAGTSMKTARDVSDLQSRFSAFRSRLWWQHVSSHGTANELLHRYQRAHALPGLAAQLIDELNDYMQHAGAIAAVGTNAFIGLVTVVALPVAVGFGVPQAAGLHGMAGVVTGFAVAVVLSAGILLSRAGRRLVIDMTHRLR